MLSVIFLVAALSSVPGALSYPAAIEQTPAQCIDPTFACQDLESAKLCNTVKTCSEDIWASLNPPADNNEICDICKEMVKEARDQLLSNMTQEEIKEVFEGSCKLLTVKVVVDACIKVVDEIIPQLVEMLASRMDPNQVCTVSGLCIVGELHIQEKVHHLFTTVLEKRKHERKVKSTNVNDELVCEFCTNVLEHIKTMITANTTVEEFRTALKNFCSLTGSFSKECTGLVNKYFDQIVAFIRNLDTKTFCTLIDLCTNQTVPLVKVMPLYEPRVKPMIKLIPASPVKNTFEPYLSPLVKIQPAMNRMKKIREDPSSIEMNDIFEKPSAQLPIERFNKPLIIFERDTECAFCKAISIYLDHDLKGNRDSDVVKRVLDNVCDKWVEGFPGHCSAFLQKHYAFLQRQLEENVATDEICSLLEACTHHIEAVKSDVKLTNVQDLECDLCKEFIQEIDDKLKDQKTQEAIKDALDSLCSYVPESLAEQCKNFIDVYSETLLTLLSEKLDPAKICAAIKICASSIRRVEVTKLDDIECDLCKELVQQIDNQLKDQKTEEAIKKALETVCSYLPSTLTDKCKQFVDTYSEMLISLLAQELDPAQVCAALNLCTGQQYKKVGGIECDLCKELIQQIDDQLKNPATQDAIKNALENFCNYLPQEFTQQCKTYVDQYSGIIVNLLLQELDPSSFCATLKLCTKIPVKVKPKKVKDMECDLCKTVVTKLDAMLVDQRTEEEIKQALDKVCSLLPSSFVGRCETFVNTYSQLLISLLAQELSPEVVCAALNLCPEQNIECEGCQYVFHFLQNQLMNPDTQDKVKNIFKQACNVLPSTYSQNCDAFVDEYGSSLLVLVAQNLDPSVVCSELRVCVNNTSNDIQMPKPSKPRPLKIDECTLCVTIVDCLDKLLEDDNVDREITSLVEKVCAYLPSSFKDQCTTVVETYGPYMLQMIGQIASSKDVCEKITMCSSTKTTPVPKQLHLVGEEKCTFGPSYWCQSHSNAVACKAEMYCKQRVWKN